ncbi:class F sortase [Streptomyces sp. NPDC056796]|uniref:class F sortase n=1 Tax=Streptomyces sp. NPDC056796 TaxID=3345947 RepID=UPI0036C1F774
MENGHTTSTSAQSFPAVKHLVWALVAGTVLVISGLRDDRPPQPPGTGAAAPATAPPTAPTPALLPSDATSASPSAPAPATSEADLAKPRTQTLAYPAPEHPVLQPPFRARWPSLAPAPLLRPPAGPSPLIPLPTGHPPAAPVDDGAARPAATPTERGRSASVPHPEVRPLPPSTPLRLRIPSIKVDAPMMKLGLNTAGALEPPPDNNPVLTGWYAGGTVPGAVGTAVTAGHVDTRLGPGAFYELGFVRKGATVEILRADARTAVFTVYAVEVYNKKNFPDRKVYGPSTRPELRLITCGGAYDRKTGYQDNVVVFATMTASR